MAYYGYAWAPYVSVGERLHQGRLEMDRLRKKGVKISPVELPGRKIASTFWGKGWCDHLESFSDYANRLPRGQRYVRNGSVCHLSLEEGKIDAYVSGSEVYTVKVNVSPLDKRTWESVKKECSGQVGSLVELLQGRFSDHVMKTVADREKGLFPRPGEMKFSCSCPDSARMCKHIAAVLYGVGARLDKQPELLFKLRGVDHAELIAVGLEADGLAAQGSSRSRKTISAAALGDVFGIELDTAPVESGIRSSGAGAEKAAKRGVPKKKIQERATSVATANPSKMAKDPGASAGKKPVGKEKTPKTKRALPVTQSAPAAKTNIQENLTQRRKDAKKKGAKKQWRKSNSRCT